jgi:signal transduction histidine kinase
MHYAKALQISRELQDNSASAACLVNLGSIFYSQYQVDSAITYYRKALNLFTLESSAYEIMQTFFIVSDAYTSKNEHDNALYYYRKGDLLYDSLFTLEKEKVINDLQIKYETEKKEKLLQQQLRKTDLAEIKSKKRMMVEIILAILLLGIIITSLFAYRIWTQKHAIAQQEVEIKNQRINKLLKEQEIRSFSYLLEGQDKERERIATDLHDRLGGLLATVKTYFQAFQEGTKNIDEQTKQQYQKAEKLLNHAVEEVRSISHNLSSGVLKKFGLEPALEDLSQTIQATDQLDVKLFISGPKKELGAKAEINVYRIIQELFSNTLKHANATKIVLQLNYREDIFNINFEDDGNGFDFHTVKKGMGISNIETRIAQLDGEWNIDSAEDRGTIIDIDIPYT